MYAIASSSYGTSTGLCLTSPLKDFAGFTSCNRLFTTPCRTAVKDKKVLEICSEMHAITKNAKTVIVRNHTAKTARFVLMRKIKDPLQTLRKQQKL